MIPATPDDSRVLIGLCREKTAFLSPAEASYITGRKVASSVVQDFKEFLSWGDGVGRYVGDSAVSPAMTCFNLMRSSGWMAMNCKPIVFPLTHRTCASSMRRGQLRPGA